MNISPIVNCEQCSHLGASVFCDLNSSLLKELNVAKTANPYQPRQIIFYEGNLPYGLYCIYSGKVKIYKTDSEGHQQIVRLANTGEVLGYRCLLADDKYSATAETLEESVICFMDKRTFNYLLEQNPATGFHIMKKLAKDLGNSEKQVLNLVHKNIRERLAELLLLFKTRYGEKNAEGTSLNIKLSREELAELVGTTQESVIRLLSEFKQLGYIKVKGRHITLLNLDALNQTANLHD